MELSTSFQRRYTCIWRFVHPCLSQLHECVFEGWQVTLWAPDKLMIGPRISAFHKVSVNKSMEGSHTTCTLAMSHLRAGTQEALGRGWGSICGRPEDASAPGISWAIQRFPRPASTNPLSGIPPTVLQRQAGQEWCMAGVREQQDTIMTFLQQVMLYSWSHNLHPYRSEIDQLSLQQHNRE